jgi:hypothetical protein
MKVGRVLGAALGCAALLMGCDEPADLQVRSAFNVDNGCPVPAIKLKHIELSFGTSTRRD